MYKMSSSEGSDDERSVSSVDSGSVPDNRENDDFPNEQPRKKRRLTPSDDEIETKPNQKPVEQLLSRVKAKNHAPRPDFTSATVLNSGITVPQEKISFANLNVKPWLVASLRNMAITRPTAIQKESIPEILKGRDCIGGSRTGSGKTVAFAVPMLQKWAEDREFAVKRIPRTY